MRYKSNAQRRAVMAKLREGDLVQTRNLRVKGVYRGLEPKGYKLLTIVKCKTRIVYTKDRPLKVK